jgi:monofunctional biosynthetic peptidoglycan transglycosylase
MAGRRRRRWRGLRALIWLVFLGLVGTGLPTLLLRWIPPPTTAFILQSEGGASRFTGRMDLDVVHRWVDLEDISPLLQLAVIASEDQKFPVHDGFDLVSIQKALRDGARGERQRGASTITQQLAKNLFLWPGRSLVRKGLEAYFTLLIEAAWPKRRILEVYLNVAQFGPGIFGVGSACELFFQKSPAEVTREEAALLATVLPNPLQLRVWKPGPYAEERQQEVLLLMEVHQRRRTLGLL